MSEPPVFRFAPSPNGDLHLGHAYSALVSSDLAAAFGGRFLLRIEDIDIGRCRPEFEASILDDLAWLGLVWETPVRRQSEHLDYYSQTLARLDALDLLYPCFATRSEIARASGPAPARDPDGGVLYPGLYRALDEKEAACRKEAGEPYALRLKMDKALAIARKRTGNDLMFRAFSRDGREQTCIANPERWGDVVVARKDVPTSYHLAVVVDDALQGVTHITRGQDLLAATDVHRLLQVLLELPEPLYHHHDLILDDAGRKLSKRDRDTSLRSLRDSGLSADDIRHRIGLGDREISLL